MSADKIQSFLEYFERIRERTNRVIRVIPPDKLEWTYKEGKFTFGDLIRHLGAIERYMYAENAEFRPSRYYGHGRDLAEGYDNVVAFLERMHRESMEIFSKLTDAELERKCITPAGTAITVGKWLRTMIEHEVHHRGQMYVYLGILGLSPPPLYGLTSEEVRAHSLGE